MPQQRGNGKQEGGHEIEHRKRAIRGVNGALEDLRGNYHEQSLPRRTRGFGCCKQERMEQQDARQSLGRGWAASRHLPITAVSQQLDVKMT